MKLKLLQKQLKDKKIDLLFLTLPDPNITYLAQEDLSYALLQITPNKATLHITKLDHVPRKKGLEIRQLKKEWQKAFTSTKIKRLAVNKSKLTVSFQETLKKIYPKAKIIDFSKELSDLRETKTETEISKLKKAASIADKALQELTENFTRKRFPTELSIALFLENHMRKQGAQVAFPTIVANQANATVPHHITSKTKLKKGFLLIDMGARYTLYNSDMTRMFYLGRPTKEEKEKFLLLQEAQYEAKQQATTNRSFKEIAKHCRSILKKDKKFFTHSLGHGIGIEVHENPRVSIKADPQQTVKENQLFTIEPGLYYKNKFGLRLEDTLLFKNKKAREITKFPRELLFLS